MSPWVLCTLLCALVALARAQSIGVPAISSLNTGVRFLYQNDLDWNRADSSRRQEGYLLLTTPLTATDAAAKCRRLGETLVPASASSNAGLQAQMSYLLYDGSYAAGQSFWAADGTALKSSSSGSLQATKPSADTKLPALCTQSAPWRAANSTDTSAKWQLTAQSNGVKFTGFRDALSFRFQAVPFANPAQRFAYSSVYDGSTSTSVTALDTTRNKQCPQNGSGPYSEQCLYANVFTPFLPTSSETQSTKALKPVLLFIHGGGYASGSGLDFTFDGGNMASRSDVVVVTPNYRLGSLGYLAYDDQIRGNYGLGDLVTALKWVQKYIKDFGGDPSRVTIAGQSAGAQHVQNLLASPQAAGLFQRAIVLSGKGHDAAFVYPTVEQARQGQAGAVVKALGCDTASNVLSCLRGKSVGDMLKNQFAMITQDGTYIRSPRLDMRSPGRAQGHVNRVPVIWGTMRDELASLGIVPPASETSFANAMKTAGIASNYSDIALRDTAAFPVNRGYSVQNLTVSVNTDIRYRCGIQGMAYASVANGVFPRVWAYFYDQRSYQIPNYDPQAACQPKGSLDPSSYYMCHSGDLMTLFHTTGTAFRLPYRDANDLPWMASIIDQFSAFVRTGNPAPAADYLRARGQAYASSLARTTAAGTTWTAMSTSNLNGLSFGPVQQRLETLGQRNDQCAAFNMGLDYIAKL